MKWLAYPKIENLLVNIVPAYLFLLQLQQLVHLHNSSRNSRIHYPNLHDIPSHLVKHTEYLATTVPLTDIELQRTQVLEECRNCCLALVFWQHNLIRNVWFHVLALIQANLAQLLSSFWQSSFPPALLSSSFCLSKIKPHPKCASIESNYILFWTTFQVDEPPDMTEIYKALNKIKELNMFNWGVRLF